MTRSRPFSLAARSGAGVGHIRGSSRVDYAFVNRVDKDMLVGAWYMHDRVGMSFVLAAPMS
eukprot:11189662-Lingulodinium_polyedra.AAC.1